MASRRGDAKTQVEQWAKLFEPYLAKTMMLTFDIRSFPVIVESVSLAKTTGMVNAPDKRIDGEKQYVPPVMQVITNAGVLKFVVEDTEVFPLGNGIRIKTASNEVDLRVTNGNHSSK